MLIPVLRRLTALAAPPRCSACGGDCSAERWVCECCRGVLEASPLQTTRPGVAAAFAYEGRARELIRALKFGGAVALADEMAELMAVRLGAQLQSVSLIIPAPAHPKRLRQRGYNQSRLLADALAERCDAEVLDCLVRDGSRRPQSELSRADRLALPVASVRVRERLFAERAKSPSEGGQTNVVVCDDVTTTGSTLETCTQVIRARLPEAGQARLRAVAFAAA